MMNQEISILVHCDNGHLRPMMLDGPRVAVVVDGIAFLVAL